MSEQRNIQSINQKLVTGLQKYLAKKSIILAGKAWSTADLVTAFTDENTTLATVATTKATWSKAVQTAKVEKATNDDLRVALHQAVLVQFGNDAEVLQTFGYNVPAKRAPKVLTKAAALVKRSVTRVARGTLGKSQREAIAGAPTTPEQIASALATALGVAPSNGGSGTPGNGTPGSGTPGNGTPGTGSSNK